MNTLLLPVRSRRESSTAQPDFYVDLLVDQHLQIDVTHNEFAIDLSELARSVNQSGEFFVLTCSCGDPGCAGIQQGVHVSHTETYVQWEISDWGRGVGASTVWTFDRNVYGHTIQRALTEMYHQLDMHPMSETTPYLLKERLLTMKIAR